LTIGSLFSGVGGLELGLEWSGLGRTVWQVEQDEFCRQVLAKHWPDVDRSVTDVRCAGAATIVPVDVICGGFPCQDVSGAGKGAGLDGARSGLWWEYLRIVSEMRPRLVIVENVASGARRWLCAVRGALHELGYRTRALGVAARDVGAPHRRERIFVVAYADGLRGVQPEGPDPEQRRRSPDGGTPGCGSDVADANSLGSEPRTRNARSERAGRDEPRGTSGDVAHAYGHGLEVRQGQRGDAGEECATAERDRGADWITQSGLGGGTHGLSAGLDRHQWPAGRGEAQHEGEPLRTVTEREPMRRARLRALGNAVVPQCAYVVGLVARQILDAER
jgi:DNA (cytosine-5)-methyltransferase 1